MCFTEFDMKPLKDQIAVVTGAGSGIGKAIALALGDCGATLILVGRRLALLEDVAAEAAARSAKAYCSPTDVSGQTSILNFTQSFARDFGRLDILVHSAGAVRMGNVADAPADDFDLLFRTNVLGPYILTQALLPHLRQQRGQIVFINSSVSMAPRAGVSQYAATKSALKALADSLRAEVNADGIRVLSVYPGRTATPTQEHLHALEGKTYRAERLLQSGDVAQAVIHSLCLPLTAEITDLHIRPMVKSG
jgi:NADP-dependent 3-hydroxy acid dehydrogenase YdfG